MNIEIQPTSDVYNTYRRLSYEPWSALAEFIDNSTQNYAANRNDILATDGEDAKLLIEIRYLSHTNKLVVFDNALGMDEAELTRAIQLNKPPADRTGRSEFGMGLKMAACWLGSNWRVVTKKLGSSVELTASMDVLALAETRATHIPITEVDGLNPELHYTRIEIDGLYRKWQGRGLGKIKEQLASMYRRDINSGHIDIHWDESPLSWSGENAYIETLPDGTKHTWSQEFSFEVAGLPVNGKGWIIIPGNNRKAGMHVFRRGRLILGGDGAGLKPTELFGGANDYQGKRIVIDLDLDHWPASMTKDSIDWGGHFEDVLAGLQSHLVGLFKKIRHIDDPSATIERNVPLIVDTLKSTLSGEEMETALMIVEQEPIEVRTQDDRHAEFLHLTDGAVPPLPFPVGVDGLPEMSAFLVSDKSANDPYAAFSFPSLDLAHVAVNLNHPFVTQVIGSNDEALQRYILVIYADALVEREFERRGRQQVPVASFRELKDKILRKIKPPE